MNRNQKNQNKMNQNQINQNDFLDPGGNLSCKECTVRDKNLYKYKRPIKSNKTLKKKRNLWRGCVDLCSLNYKSFNEIKLWGGLPTVLAQTKLNYILC